MDKRFIGPMLIHEHLEPEEVWSYIRSNTIRFGGNRRLNIYGHLSCKSGKGMKRENRVFFSSEQEAKQLGYRPCGHCMPEAYKNWKNETI